MENGAQVTSLKFCLEFQAFKLESLKKISMFLKKVLLAANFNSRFMRNFRLASQEILFFHVILKNVLIFNVQCFLFC